jgi:hypothetical protein
VGDIKRNLAKLRRELEGLREQGGVRTSELERLARKLGRRLTRRGRHPTWVNQDLPQANPLTIPSHPGDLNRFTAGSILNQLETDLDSLERLAEEKSEG